MKTTVNDIVALIISTELTPADMTTISNAYSMKRKMLADTAKKMFRVGDKVWFKGRAGSPVVCKLYKKNPKRMVVEVIEAGEYEKGMMLTVGPTMLHAVT